MLISIVLNHFMVRETKDKKFSNTSHTFSSFPPPFEFKKRFKLTSSTFITGRQKTLSVKWRQSTAETKLRDARCLTPKVRSPTETQPPCIGENNLMKQNSVEAATRDVVTPAEIDLKFDCLQPRDSMRKAIVIRSEATGYSASNGKSDSC
jgi:hypothetical protein